MSEKRIPRRVSLHLLRTVAPSNANRDREGDPKQVVYNGVPRMRWSSQSIVSALRSSPVFDELRERELLSDNTRDILVALSEELAADSDEPWRVYMGALALACALNDKKVYKAASKGKTGGMVKALPEAAVALRDYLDGEDAQDPRKLSAAFKVKQREQRVLREALQTLSEISDFDAPVPSPKSEDEREAKGAAADKLRKVRRAEVQSYADELEACAELAARAIQDFDEAATTVNVDTAMFGRMTANLPVEGEESCVQIAHGLGTTPLEVEEDFFSARDVFSADTGGSHMGYKRFATGVIYQFANIEVAELVERFGDAELAAEAVGRFVEALILTTPGGMQAKMSTLIPAGYVCVQVGDGPPLQGTGAFEVPVREEAALRASAKRLHQHVERMTESLNVQPEASLWWTSHLDDLPEGGRCRTLNDLKDALAQALLSV